MFKNVFFCSDDSRIHTRKGSPLRDEQKVLEFLSDKFLRDKEEVLTHTNCHPSWAARQILVVDHKTSRFSFR